MFSASTANRVRIVSTPAPAGKEPPVEIGRHWSREHAVYIDRQTGVFWERNPAMSASDLRVQAALLRGAK